jgi:hypothetical protein
MAVTKKKVALVAPVKRFNTSSGEPVEIKMTCKARQSKTDDNAGDSKIPGDRKIKIYSTYKPRRMPDITKEVMEGFQSIVEEQ